MGRQKLLRASLRKPWQRYWLIGEMHNLKKKGYALALENGRLQVDISPSRLRRIIDNPRSASTNSLMVKVLEHLAGNLMQNGQSPLRSNRDSIEAHNRRSDNYDPLIGNLLGYGTAFMYGPTNTEGLSMILERAAARMLPGRRQPQIPVRAAHTVSLIRLATCTSITRSCWIASATT